MASLLGRGLVYLSLLILLVAFVASGFAVAEKGMNAMVGTNGPPKTIGVTTQPKAVQVSVLGKTVVEADTTLGDQWSRKIESTSSTIGPIIDRIAIDTGRTIQLLSKGILDWLSEKTSSAINRALASK